MRTYHCEVCGRPFERTGNKRMCGDAPCLKEADRRRKERARARRSGRRIARHRRVKRDPLVQTELEAYRERYAAKMAAVHEEMEARRERWGDVSGRDVIRYMLRGVA